MTNKKISKCDRCQAEAGQAHPLHGFKVRLETTNYKGKSLSVCQRCKIQIDVKKKKLDESDQKNRKPITSFFSRLFRF
ncbi:MAG: hypothetical protein FH748_01250 [Balneolaceae bacterium]|nr:hypothetical protein [Balneolaceae bacterium]